MPTILGANTLSGYDVANSLRFNAADSPKISKTISDGHDTNATFSCWFKRSKNGEAQTLFEVYEDSSNFFRVRLEADDLLQVRDMESGANQTRLKTTQVFKDTSAWYNVVVIIDTTDGTAGDRCKIFINGTRVTSFGTQVNYDQNDVIQAGVNGSSAMLGAAGANNNYLDGYIAEAVFLDGTSQAVTGFGEFDEDTPNVWKPIDVSGLTFGTNGFYLDFEDSSNLGNDKNGGTDLTEANIASTDQSTDTCTNNFATLNPLDVTRLANVGNTFTEGNLVVTDGSSNYLVANGSIAVTAGKWYFEVKMIESTASHVASGVMVVNLDLDDKSDGAANGNHGWLYATNGQKRNAGTSSNYGDTYTQNDIIGVALDMDNKAIYFSKNGTFQASGDPTSGASKTNAAYTNLAGTITAQVYDGQGAEAHEFSMNFGSPNHSVSSGNADANGHGNFEYAVPSGYFALCSKNLAEFG
tara:strand:+ start:549 stop:1952 length:1404 start_codon:yes stop_codon:yes gene_type:complete